MCKSDLKRLFWYEDRDGSKLQTRSEVEVHVGKESYTRVRADAGGQGSSFLV